MDISSDAAICNAEDYEKIERQRESFVASISHDLKNPTIAQIRALELILKGKFGRVLPQQREIMEMVLDSCKYMNSMLCSLLYTYRNEKGTIKLNNEEVSIADLTVECVDEMIYMAKDKEIDISVTNSADKEIVHGDKVQLRRVIMNLLTNSIKYAFRQTKVFINVYNEDNYTCFKFENESPYLSEEKRKKIFARYVSFSQSDKINGIGLGLYASQKIVEAHGGEIFVESYKENKNIFGFKIPNDECLKNSERTVTF